MLDHFPKNVLESVVRLNHTDKDFKTLVDWLSQQGFNIADQTLTMKGEDMYKTQGAALIIKALVAQIDKSAETMRAKQDRMEKKQSDSLKRQFRNAL